MRRQSPRLAVAIGLARGASLATRALRRGGGTALPGLIAEKVDPAALARLGRQLGRGRLLITGTNGKTTTARLLASILAAADIPAIHNRAGSNLTRGILSTLVDRAAPSGAIPDGDQTLGLFEVDEASLPAATAALAPTALAFTNLFRDQLDRYGEVDHVAALWRRSLAAAPPGSTLVLNADDPSVAELAQEHPGPVHWFGIDDPALASDDPGASDARWSHATGAGYEYDLRYFAHIGHWRLEQGDWRRPTPDTRAASVALERDSASFDLNGAGRATLGVSGLYNIYNALAAAALARVLGIDDATIVRGLAAGQAAFGRQERFEVEGRRIHLLLCKNPAGANQVCHLLGALEGEHQVAVLLNDRFADGQDVSWIWDVDYERIAGRVTCAWAGGDRAGDIALRLQYAGWPPPEMHGEPAALLDAVIRGSEPGSDVYILPTYTAMLDLRAEIVRRGYATAFWDQ